MRRTTGGGVERNRPRRWWIALVAGAVVTLSTLAAQEGASGEEPLTVQQIQAARGLAEKDESLTEDRRKQILDLYDQALGSLADEAKLKQQARRHERERANVGREIKSLQAELDRPTTPPTINLPDNASVARIERLLTQERAELEARRQAIQDLQKLAENRAARRTEIARRIGRLNQQTDDLGDQLRSLGQLDMSEALREATRAQLRAALRKIGQEIATLRAEQALLDSQNELIPLRRDRAQRRTADSERLVAMLEQRALESKRSEAESSLERVHKLCKDASEQAPVLEELANETREMAEELWGEESIVVASEDLAQRITTIGKHISQITQIASLTRRKFEAVRLRGISAQWWPKIPDDLPQPAELRRAIRRREALLPNVQHQLIVLEERRVEVGNIEPQVESWVNRVRQVNETIAQRDLERVVRSLVSTRRELLDELIKQYTRYADQLFESTTQARELLTTITELDTYIMERVLWTRSVPGPKIPPARDVVGGFRWLFLNPEWGGLLRVALGSVDLYLWLGFGLAVIVPLLLFRKRLKAVLRRCHAQATEPDCSSYAPTVKALLVTLALSAPLPLIFLWLNRLLRVPGDSELARAAAGGFLALGVGSAIFELLSEVFRPRGLADGNFGWTPELAGSIHRTVHSYLRAALPTAFVTVALATEGLRFHSQPDLRAFSNGLGRICFVLTVLIVLSGVRRIFGPQGDLMRECRDRSPDSWANRLRHFWFPGIGVVLAFPAVLAAFGYYVTGFVIANYTVQTVGLTLVLILIREMLVRWRFLKHPGGTETAEEILVQDPQQEARARLMTAHAQVRQLTGFALGLVWVAGLLVIWSSVLPSFQIFSRIQIWPDIRVIEESRALGPAPEGPQQVTQRPEAAAAARPAQGLLNVSPASEPGSVPPGPDQNSLLLSQLLKALLALFLTVLLAKNLPGFLEVAFLKKMPIERGVRTAITTLIRYFVTLLGIAVVSNIIGLGWQKIQWLAAALTFGLGFGLQEIFANFVSGLILLIDRPIRVGDVVTVGDVGGWVTRISIRATTITKWDRSELIVPNKEFITNQLINWTLSDSLTRVELQVGVEYGTDVEKVRQILLDIAHEHPAVLDKPAPYVVLMEFGDNSINFDLRVYLRYEYGRLTIRDEIHRAIVRKFAKNDIVIAFPQLDVHVKSNGETAAPVAGKLLPPEERAPEGLHDDGDD